MKRFLIVLVCVGVALPVLAFRQAGQPSKFVKTFVATDDKLETGADGTRFLGSASILFKLREGKPLSVGVSAKGVNKNEAQLREIVLFYYRSWFANARHHIQAQHREREFAWAWNLLDPERIQISIEPHGKDLNFTWVPATQITGHAAGGRVTGMEFNGDVTCPLESLNKSQSDVCLHEVGHTLGLGEQYLGNSRRNSEIGSQRMELNGMMSAGGGNRRFSADDATGLLVLLSLTFPEKNRPKVRSLMPGSDEVFVNGMSSHNGPLSIVQDRADKSVFFVTRNNSGAGADRFSVNMHASLDNFANLQLDKKQPPQIDKLQRPIYAEGKNGEKFYFAYAAADENYGPKKVLIVKEGKVLFYLENEYNNQGAAIRLDAHHLYFGTNGKEWVKVSWLAPSKKYPQGAIEWTRNELKKGEIVPNSHFSCLYAVQNGQLVTKKEGAGCQERGAEKGLETAVNEQVFRSQLLRWKDYAIPWLEKDVVYWGRVKMR